jgi:zinc finger of C3HC4-type, RING
MWGQASSHETDSASGWVVVTIKGWWLMWGQASAHETALRQFQCRVCNQTLREPVSTPCDHNFCKSCLDSHFQKQVLPNP